MTVSAANVDRNSIRHDSQRVAGSVAGSHRHLVHVLAPTSCSIGSTACVELVKTRSLPSPSKSGGLRLDNVGLMFRGRIDAETDGRRCMWVELAALGLGAGGVVVWWRGDGGSELQRRAGNGKGSVGRISLAWVRGRSFRAAEANDFAHFVELPISYALVIRSIRRPARPFPPLRPPVCLS